MQEHRTLRFLFTTVAVLFLLSAQASTFQASDGQKLQALRKRLYTVTVDVTHAVNQSVEIGNYSVVNCLSLIHDQGQNVSTIAAGVSDLMVLSLLMKDSDDELQVLRALQTWLAVLTGSLPKARDIINRAMVQCSSSPSANAKGQALLNELSNWDDPIEQFSRTVNRAIPAKR